MFGAVMSQPENCQVFLERVLEFPVGNIEVDLEKSIVYHPEYKGIRLDVYAKDDLNRRFNVEIQVLQEPSPGKRSRYYHSQIDMELLLTGMDYESLPDTYVIFVCDYDPFYAGKYRYVFRNLCLEDETIHLQDGSFSIFLNTKGKNEEEVSRELSNLLSFIGADLIDSQKDYEDPYIRQLQKSVNNIKHDREMGKRYMLLEEFLNQHYKLGKAEGKAEGIAEGKAASILFFLSKKEIVSPDLSAHIMKETDLQTLDQWLDLAVSAASVEQFMKSINFTI